MVIVQGGADHAGHVYTVKICGNQEASQQSWALKAKEQWVSGGKRLGEGRKSGGGATGDAAEN